MNDIAPDPALADPMLRVLRERHPEVDIVLLPGPAARPDVPTLAAAERDALAHSTEVLVDDVLAHLSREPAWTGSAREGRWRNDSQGLTRYEVVVVVSGLEEGANIDLLRATGAAMLGLGWQARPIPGNRPRLAARRAGVSATATVRSTQFLLTVQSSWVGVPA